jgi:hypothetical protein
MNIRQTKLIIGLVFVMGLTGFAQSPNSSAHKNEDTHPTASASASQAAKLPKESERRPFQVRAFVGPQSGAVDSSTIPIPAGKRLVIEHISAISRCPVGFRMELQLYSYYDNNADGVGDVQDITFHRITLTDQGVYNGMAVATANHKVLIYADEQIGNSHFHVGFQGQLDGTTTGFTQGQVTITGYLEDLPTAP